MAKSFRRARTAVLVYGALALAALGWAVLRGAPNLYAHPAPWIAAPFPASTVLGLALGGLVALGVVVSTRMLVRRAAWTRKLHTQFRDLLCPLERHEIAIFALTSGVAEEMFFRGAMQPALGLALSSVIFGALHVGPGRMWPWTLWAVIMGFVFGALFALTGQLAGPIAAHVIINYANLRFIEAYDPLSAGTGPLN